MGQPLNISITYASEKGSDINGAEADANFRALVAAIQQLSVLGGGSTLANIKVNQTTNIATFVDTNNAVLGAFTLPPRPVRPAGTWAASKKTAGIVRCVVPIDDRMSVYAAAGDWLPGLCWAVVAIGLVGPWVRQRVRG